MATTTQNSHAQIPYHSSTRTAALTAAQRTDETSSGSAAARDRPRKAKTAPHGMSIEPQLRAIDAIGRERVAADFNVRGPRPDWQDSRPHVPPREHLIAADYNPRLDPSLNRGYVKPRPGGSGLNGAARVNVPVPGSGGGGVSLSDMGGTMGGERRAWGSNNPAPINFAASGGAAAITSSSSNYGGAFAAGGGGRLGAAPLSPFSADIAELRGARRLRQYLKNGGGVGAGGGTSDSGLELLTDHAEDWSQLRQHQQHQRYMQEAAWADKYGLPPPGATNAAAAAAPGAGGAAPPHGAAAAVPPAAASSAPVVYVAGAHPPPALSPVAARAAKAARGPWMLPSTAAALAATTAAAAPQQQPRSRVASEAANKPAPERIVLVQFPTKAGAPTPAAGAADAAAGEYSDEDGEMGAPLALAARLNRRANSLIISGSRSMAVAAAPTGPTAAAGLGPDSGPSSASGALLGGSGASLLHPALSSLAAAQGSGLHGSITAPSSVVGTAALAPTAQPGAATSFAAGRVGPLRGSFAAAAAAAAAAAPGGSRSASGGYSGSGAAPESPALLPPTGSAALTTAAAAAAAAAGFVPSVERVHTTYALPSHALTTGADKLDPRALATAAQLIEVVEVVQPPRLAGAASLMAGVPGLAGASPQLGAARMPRFSQQGEVGGAGGYRSAAAGSSGASPSFAAAGAAGAAGGGGFESGVFGAVGGSGGAGYGSVFAGVQARTRRHSTSEALGAPPGGLLLGRSPVKQQLVASTSMAASGAAGMGVGPEGSELLAPYGEGPDGEPSTPRGGDGNAGGFLLDDEASAEERQGGGAHEGALHRFRAAAGAAVAAARWKQVAGAGTQVTPGAFSRVQEVTTDTAATAKSLGLVPALVTSRTQVVVTATAVAVAASTSAAAAPAASVSAVTRRLKLQAAAQLQHHHHHKSWSGEAGSGSESTSLNTTGAMGGNGGAEGRPRPSASSSLRGGSLATVAAAAASPAPASPQVLSDRPSPGGAPSPALPRGLAAAVPTPGGAGGSGGASASGVSMGIIPEDEEASSEHEGAAGDAQRRSEPGGIRSAASPLPPASPLLMGSLPPRPSPQAALRSQSMHTFGSVAGGSYSSAKLGTLSPVVGPTGLRRAPRSSEPSGSTLQPAAAAAAGEGGGLLAAEVSASRLAGSLPLTAGAGLAASLLVGQSPGGGGGGGALHRLLVEQQRLMSQLPGASGYRRGGGAGGSGGEALGAPAAVVAEAVAAAASQPLESGGEPAAEQPLVPLPQPSGTAEDARMDGAHEAVVPLAAESSLTSGLRSQQQGPSKRHSWGGGALMPQRSAGNLSVRSGGGGSGGGAASPAPSGSEGGAGQPLARRVGSRALLAPDLLSNASSAVAASGEASSVTFGGAVPALDAEPSGPVAPVMPVAPSTVTTTATAAAADAVAVAAAAFAPQPPQQVQVQEPAPASPRAPGIGSRPSRLLVEVPSASSQPQEPMAPQPEHSVSSTGAAASPRPPASPRHPQPASLRPQLGASAATAISPTAAAALRAAAAATATAAAQEVESDNAATAGAEAEPQGQHRSARPPSALMVPAPPQRPASPGSGSGYLSPGSRSVSGNTAASTSGSLAITSGTAGSSTTASGSSSLSRGFSGRALLRPAVNSSSVSMPGEVTPSAAGASILVASVPLPQASAVSSSGEALSSLSQPLTTHVSSLMARVQLGPSPLSASGAAPEAEDCQGRSGTVSGFAARPIQIQGPGPLGAHAEGDGDGSVVRDAVVWDDGSSVDGEAQMQATPGWGGPSRSGSVRSGATTRRVY